MSVRVSSLGSPLYLHGELHGIHFGKSGSHLVHRLQIVVLLAEAQEHLLGSVGNAPFLAALPGLLHPCHEEPVGLLQALRRYGLESKTRKKQVIEQQSNYQARKRGVVQKQGLKRRRAHGRNIFASRSIEGFKNDTLEREPLT